MSGKQRANEQNIMDINSMALVEDLVHNLDIKNKNGSFFKWSQEVVDKCEDFRISFEEDNDQVGFYGERIQHKD